MSQRRFELGWYNGWSPEQRLATLPIQREAIRSGALRRPSACSVCGSTEDIWLHDERYDRPLEAYAICRPCHGALHGRFEDPARWQAILEAYGNGERWFEGLSLDPASQRRPFEETYPEGLAPGDA